MRPKWTKAYGVDDENNKSNNTSGILGVTKRGDAWKANALDKVGKRKYLGCYDTKEDAAAAIVSYGRGEWTKPTRRKTFDGHIGVSNQDDGHVGLASATQPMTLIPMSVPMSVPMSEIPAPLPISSSSIGGIVAAPVAAASAAVIPSPVVATSTASSTRGKRGRGDEEAAAVTLAQISEPATGKAKKTKK